jgi:glutaredoxin 3
MNSTSIILYVKTGCPWCRMAEDYLDKGSYKYQRVDVRRDPDSLKELRRVSGQTSTPTLLVGELILPDFGPDELEEFLSEHDIQP